MALVTGTGLAAVLDLDYVSDVDGGPGFDQVAATADVTVAGLLVDGDHSEHPQCREAAQIVAIELWQARFAPGGQPLGVDFQAGPARLSAYLTKRVSALTAAHANVRGWIG